MTPLLPTALAAALLLTACQSAGVRRIERRLDILADSVREKLGPDRLVVGWGRRLGHAVEKAPEVLFDDDPRQLRRSLERTAAGVPRELARVDRVAAAVPKLAGKAGRRLRHLSDPPDTWRILGPDRAARSVRHIAEDWPQLLMLDKPILPDRRDARYRTDPTDDRPEAGWLERILVRLGI